MVSLFADGQEKNSDGFPALFGLLPRFSAGMVKSAT